MEQQISTVHLMHMAKRKQRPVAKALYKRTFLREWRGQMSLEEAAAAIGVTHGQLSRIERGLSPYSQRIMEAAAALYGCSETDLLARGPNDAEELYGIVSGLSSAQRQQAARVLKALKDDAK